MAKKQRIFQSGTDAADLLDGTFNHDEILGLLGADTLHGWGGADTILGGDDNDVIYGGGGSDKLFGDAGDDRLYGGAGKDFLNGGNGHDQLFGGKGNDTLVAGVGNDTLDGGAGVDQVSFSGTINQYNIGLGSSAGMVVLGAQGQSSIINTEKFSFAGSVLTLAAGSAGADDFGFSATSDMIVTGNGADSIHAYINGYGDDHLAAGDDVIVDFNVGKDTLYLHLDPAAPESIGTSYDSFDSFGNLIGHCWDFGNGDTLLLRGVAGFQLSPDNLVYL